MTKASLMEADGIQFKLECVNPTGSIKDRIAAYILDAAEREGLLRPGMNIVEATSGNTGIALAYQAKIRGYPITLVMPENMTEERKRRIRQHGAQLVLCSAEGSFAEAIEIRDQIAKNPNFYCPDQFSNPLNVECHYRTTAQEILRDLRRAPGSFVAAVGTGGTIMGVGRALREAFPNIKIFAVEPAESAVMSGGNPGQHGIQGIGDGFIPSLVQGKDGGLDPLINGVVTVSTAEAIAAAHQLRRAHGLCVGTSSGANYAAARLVSQLHKPAVTIFPDGYAKYHCFGLSRATCPPCPVAHLCPERSLP